VRCRYMDLTRAEAIAEIERLIAGEPSGKVLSKCISCYACNAFCPEDANPYHLILDRWHKRYRERGLPVRASYLLPYHSPNYRTDVEAEMSPREKELLAGWKSAPAEGEFLYPGCNLLTVPYLFDLQVLERLPVSGDWNLCCGEPLYRMGLFDVMEKIAKGLENYYRDKPVEKMVFVCPACYNMMKNVLPGEFGAKLDFECEYIVPWLLRAMDRGEFTIKRPLDKKVAVHDSCHARILGSEIMESSRELYRRLGLTVINMKNHHEDGLCCGIAAGCNRYMPQDIVAASVRELREGDSTGAEETAIYCTGCYIMMNLTKRMWPGGNRLVHTLEYLAEACGQPAERKIEQRSAGMLKKIVTKAVPKMLSRKRHRVEDPEVGRG